MIKDSMDRGFYFQVFKQDLLKKDLWIEDVTVFSRDVASAAQLYVEVHCQLNDYVHSIKEISNDEFDILVKGEHNYECKFKLKFHFEMDIEIPAYLRNY
jgi:hypothetical protein